MAILEHQLRSASTTEVTGVLRHLLSRNQYHAMISAGIFRRRRLELIEGEIVEMAPVGPAHASFKYPLAKLLEGAFGPSFLVRTQDPVSIGDDEIASEPEPDIAVVDGSWSDYVTRASPGCRN